MGSLAIMEKELYSAAVKGNREVLSEENIGKHGNAYYKDQTTPTKNNIIHIAAEHGQAAFIQDAYVRFPELACRKNGNMDTPLHVAARKGYEDIVRLLISFEGCATEEESKAEEHWPWMARNLQGDTPLHMALSNNKLRVAMDLINLGSPVLLSLVNDSQETPLHIFLKYCIGIHTTADTLLEEGVLNLQGVYRIKGYMSTQKSRPNIMVKEWLTELLTYKGATYLRDAEGLTPLLIAAQKGSFLALQLILEHCPQSAEICDRQGKTMLHHLKIVPSQNNIQAQDHDQCGQEPKTTLQELKELLNLPEIDAIKNAKDIHGNTPAHVALANRDFVLVKVLFESFADFTIKNKRGDSALHLIKSCPDFITKMEEIIAIEGLSDKLIKKEFIQAAEEGNVTLFMNRTSETDIESHEVTYTGNDDCFLSRTRQGHSILHIAVRHGHQTFVEEAIKHFPSLVLTADLKGDTPLHAGARLKKYQYLVAEKLLELTKNCVDNFRDEAGSLFLEALPWRQKNSKGDTPLHEALRSSNYNMASDLIEIDSELCSFENNAGETPLHILARYSTYSKSDAIGTLVKLLIGHNHSVVYKRDSHGFTPLLRASYCGRIRVAYWIIRSCPTSVQFRDHKGRNFLHLLRLEPDAELDAMTVEDMLYVYTNILVLTSEAECDGCQGPVLMSPCKYKDMRMLTGAEFDILRSSQDQDGNTPLHYALKNKNFGAAKFLLHWCLRSEGMQEMTIINNEGKSVLNLLELLVNEAASWKDVKALASLAQEKIKKEAFGKKMMKKEVYEEAVKGITRSDDDGNCDSDFLSQVAPDGSNILHIAIHHGKQEFAQKVIERYPHFIWERDSNGETPLHTFAKLWIVGDLKLYNLFKAQWEEACRKYHDSPSEEGFLIIPPWRVKNSQGNTPLHEAAKVGTVAMMLYFDFEVTTYVNRAGDAPLYSVRFSSSGIDNYMRLAMYVRNWEGLTPLLRAAKDGDILYASRILNQWPESIQIRDDRGRSFLHHLRVTEDEDLKEIAREFHEKPMVNALRQTMDFDGNTPLHSAIQSGNSTGAMILAKRFFHDSNFFDVDVQLRVRNNEGKSVMDLLASHDDAPNEVLQLLINKSYLGANVHGLYMKGGWVRSAYGVCKSQIKEMSSTLSVVAGLLATITFAAAFQVPGGFDGGSGSPVLLHRAAFKAFMIFNSFAMCGSMTVLFFLLWVMLTGSATNSFMLLDLSIAILQLSFGATILSFMTGVYVATSHKALWLAISICGLCSTIIVLLRKNFVLPIAQFVKFALQRFGWFKFAHC